MDTDDDADAVTKKSSSKSKKKERRVAAQEKKRAAKRDRRIIESLVDQNLDVELPLPSSAKASSSKTDSRPLFRYRDTSPTSFGLTPLEILAASDAQLNEFVGLKKLAAFRDPVRKRKDKKLLSKKARLREWRKDVFGHRDGIREQREVVEERAAELHGVQDGRVEKSGKKKKRSRKAKTVEVDAQSAQADPA